MFTDTRDAVLVSTSPAAIRSTRGESPIEETIPRGFKEARVRLLGLGQEKRDGVGGSCERNELTRTRVACDSTSLLSPLTDFSKNNCAAWFDVTDRFKSTAPAASQGVRGIIHAPLHNDSKPHS